MKIGVAVAIVISLIKGEGGVVPPVTPAGDYTTDDAETFFYFADDALTERYVTG